MSERKLIEGEVIRTRNKKFPPTYHYGIVVYQDSNPYILHNPLSQSPMMDTPDDFFETRFFEKSFGVLHNKTSDELIQEYENLKNYNFSLLFFNCEDFVNILIGRHIFDSARLVFFAFVAIYIFLVVKLTKHFLVK